MGNTSQCGFNTDSQLNYKLLERENHFIYGQIQHFLKLNGQNQHLALKTLKFQTEKQHAQFKQFIHSYQQISQFLPLIRASEYVKAKKSQKPSTAQQENTVKQDASPFFECNKQNFLFKSKSQQISASCSPSLQLSIVLNLDYVTENRSLKVILMEKSCALKRCLENNKINQNILLELQNKVKLCDYSKIDKLPHKERSLVNMFFNQIQVLRMLDCMLSSLYGLKIYGNQSDSVRPQLFFKEEKSQKIQYFYPRITNFNGLSNFQKTFRNFKKWFEQQNAMFHHNWSLKDRQFVSYIHPDYLQRMAQILIEQEKCQNIIAKRMKLTNCQIQKQNIFSLGLIIVQICLLQPEICSKVYQFTISKQQISAKTKKQFKLSQKKQNLTLKINKSVIKRYLSEIKAKYSDNFATLIQNMLLGSLQDRQGTYGDDKLQKYEQVIQKLSELIIQNVNNLKSVYSSSQKPKSLSKNVSQKNSRKSSLSRQVSVSGVTNSSLSSSSSLSMVPFQSQQKIMSLQLLKKNCKHFQKNVQKILIKSQLGRLHESFLKNQDKIQDLILKDQQRILGQLNKINNQNSMSIKMRRFNYRKIQNNGKSDDCSDTNQNNLESNADIQIDKTLIYPNSQYPNQQSIYDVQFKLQRLSRQKERRMNSTAKAKRLKLQNARQEQALGNSLCRTVLINQQTFQNMQDKNNSTLNFSNIASKLQENNYKNGAFNGQISQNCYVPQNSHISQKQSFFEDLNRNYSSKSELKNLITLKNKTNVSKNPRELLCTNEQQISQKNNLKELKSKQLYQIYLKQYKNLAKKQAASPV